MTCIFILTITIFCPTFFFLTYLIYKIYLLIHSILSVDLIHINFYSWYNLSAKKQTRVYSSGRTMSVDSHNKRLSLLSERYDGTATDARLSFGCMKNCEVLNIRNFSLKFFSFEIDVLNGGWSCKILTWISNNFKSRIFLDLD